MECTQVARTEFMKLNCTKQKVATTRKKRGKTDTHTYNKKQIALSTQHDRFLYMVVETYVFALATARGLNISTRQTTDNVQVTSYHNEKLISQLS